MDIVEQSGIPQHIVHYRTFYREIQGLGYAFQPNRKKCIHTDGDLKLCCEFAQSTLKSLCTDYWTKDVAFYLDGVSFVYKGNPMSVATKPKNRIWQKKSEGLVMTTKGSKDLAGGKRLHLIVVISYGKGVILAEPYEKMNAEFFAKTTKNVCNGQ